MSAYLYGNKYYVVQKGYKNLNLGFLIQARRSDFQNSECIRITGDGVKKSWIPALHLQKSHVWVWIIGFPPPPGLATPTHVSLSGIWWGCFPVQISRGPSPAPWNLWGYQAVLADPLRPSQWCLSDYTFKGTSCHPEPWTSPCPVSWVFLLQSSVFLSPCNASSPGLFCSLQPPAPWRQGRWALPSPCRACPGHWLRAARPPLTEVGVDGLCS